MDSSVKKGVIVVIVFLVAILSLLAIFDLAGGFGRFLYRLLELLFGWGFWTFPLVLILAGYLSLANHRHSFQTRNWVGVFLLIVGYSGLFHLIYNAAVFQEALREGNGGGYVGFAIAWPLSQIMGRWAAMAVTVALLIIGLLLTFEMTLERLIEHITLKSVRDRVRGKKEESDSEEVDWEKEEPSFNEDTVNGEEEESGDEEEQESKKSRNQESNGEKDWEDEEGIEFMEKDIQDANDANRSEYDTNEDMRASVKKRRKYPKIDIPLDLLSNKTSKPTARDVETCQRVIKKTLQNFGVEVEMGELSIGPTVTQYTFRPADGVKLSRIVGLSNDLALALAAHPIRIEAPIPGKSLVGIEVPNQKIAVVPLREVLESAEFKHRESNLSIVLGKDVAGKPWIADLDRLPHLLVAGATNSGKTVCLNSIIISLLYQNQPDDLKFIMVDPKRVEMIGYNGIPHLITPVITDVKKTINALKWTIGEMERRFHVLSNAGKRNIASYNAARPQNKLSYLVFIIDELADLMSMALAEVEAAVIRLAQMSRAVGIHLVLATQRPSVDIITGLIKANIPGRIAFSVASLTDSRTILDVSGAEKLLGRGDMLYTSAELSKPKRIQGAFCSDKDIESVVEYLRDKGEPDYEEGVTEKPTSMGLGGVVLGGGDDDDELLGEARELIVEEGKASASFLQRRLKVGYARAARLLDLLEERGVVGPVNGAKPREILVKKGEMSLHEQGTRMIKSNADDTRMDTDYSNEEDDEQLTINDYQEESELDDEEEIEKLRNEEIEELEEDLEVEENNNQLTVNGNREEGGDDNEEEEESEEDYSDDTRMDAYDADEEEEEEEGIEENEGEEVEEDVENEEQEERGNEDKYRF